MAYAVVRTDNMTGTDVRAELVSLRYVVETEGDDEEVIVTPTAIENGNVVLLGALEEGSREVYTATAPAANSDLNKVVLVASPEVMYDEHKHNLDEYINEAGKISRGYYMHERNIFSVTADAFANANPAVGQIVELKAGTKLNNVSSLTSGSTKVGEIIDKNVVGRYTYYAVKIG